MEETNPRSTLLDDYKLATTNLGRKPSSRILGVATVTLNNAAPKEVLKTPVAMATGVKETCSNGEIPLLAC